MTIYWIYDTYLVKYLLQHALKIKGRFSELKNLFNSFGETFSISARSSRVKFIILTGNITYENEIIKKEILSAILIKHFYSQVMNIFVEVHNKEMWTKSFLVIKPKRKLFVFTHWKKHYIKNNSGQHPFNLGQLWLLEVSRHCQTGRNLGAICMTTIQYFLMENVQWKYLQHELWRNNKFCWVVGGNIIPQMKSIFQKYYLWNVFKTSVSNLFSGSISYKNNEIFVQVS